MIEIKYIAGFWDGEGSITIQKQKWKSKNKSGFQHFLFIKASNTNKEVLEKIKDYFRVGTITIYRSDKPNIRESWQYQSSANDAYMIIKKLCPYLIIKKEQAKLALYFQERMNKNKKRCMRYDHITLEELDFRESIKKRIHNLNKGLDEYDGFKKVEF